MKMKDNKSRITDLVLGKLTEAEAADLLEEIEKDPQLSESLEFAILVHNFVQGEGQDLFTGRIRSEKSSIRQFCERAGAAILGLRGIRIAVPLLGAISVAAVFLFLTNLHHKDLFSNPQDQWLSWGTQRTAMSNDLIDAQVEVENGHFDRALHLLSRHLRAYPLDPLADQVRYNCAVLLLHSARSTFCGVWICNDTSSVAKALVLLDEVRSSQASDALKCRASLLRAKALISIGQYIGAKEDLLRLSGFENECRSEASELLRGQNPQ